jgi:hypothetical protein
MAVRRTGEGRVFCSFDAKTSAEQHYGDSDFRIIKLSDIIYH